MAPRAFLVAAFAALGAVTLGAVGAGVWLVSTGLPEEAESLHQIVVVYGGGVGFLLLAIVVVTWAYLDHTLAMPLTGLVRGIQTVIHANPDHAIEIEDEHRLGDLPDAVKELARHLNAVRRTVNEAVISATASTEAQKGQLEAILRDLHEGVVVCNLNHQILLYNHRAVEILHVAGELGLGRSLFSVTNREPFLHALERLINRVNRGEHRSHPRGLSVAFVGSTKDGRHILEGQMSLVPDGEGRPSSYVITFEDNTEELAALGTRDRLLREATEGLRGPVANLRAAAEILSSYPEMDPAEQGRFEEVVFNESKYLSERLESLAHDYRSLITGDWPMADVYSANVLNSVVRRLREEQEIHAVMTGIPQWLHCDSYSVVELLDHVIHRVSEAASVTSFDLEAAAGERHVYLDVIWKGEPIPAATLHSWLEATLEQTLGGMTARDVLEHHKTELWSLPHRQGHARLRLPLRPAKQATISAAQRERRPRPEFYDFGLLKRPARLEALGQQPLKELTYVVFDTETTGLRPSAGDEIIQIAGVRVVNGRILTGESFSRLVNPGRAIPPESVRFHGITDDMVEDKPPARLVLPQFKDFIGDAVLVAHNAAFDMKFIKLKEPECGVVFDNPVLDTLLLSVYLHDHTPKHTLDAIADRFGIAIQGRHTALGDSLVTAGVFLRMLEILDAWGVQTLDQAIEASNKIVEVRAKQAKF